MEWPAEKLENSDSFIFCVVGPNPFGSVMNAFEKEQIHGKDVLVRYHEKVKEADACHVVFISSSLGRKGEALLEELAGRAILSIGETYDFIQSGGMISFVREGTKIRFEINQQTAENSGLRISSKLLNLAKRVIAKENRDA